MKSVVPHYIAKIEGHGSLRIDFSADTAELRIHEGERLFEAMLVGRDYRDGVFIPQRICGVCPTAHCTAAIKALEYAMGVTPPKQARNLRKLMLAGQMIQSHALHLFFLALPDYLHIDNTLALAEAAPDKFRMALNLKKIGDKIVEVVGGRPVHPITPAVGGFTQAPPEAGLKRLRDELELTLEDAVGAARLFASLSYPEFSRPTEYLSILADNKYGFYGGAISSSTGEVFEIADYRTHISEIVKPYSTAKFAQRRRHGIMVGALSRLNLHSTHLNPLAAEELERSKIGFPSYNSFHNNFAQAVETVHFIEEAVILLETILADGLTDLSVEVEPRAGEGVGAVEAPRGTLYYTYAVGDDGKIRDCNIVTPTVQNLSNIEEDAGELLHVTEGKSQRERERLLEMLLRAYDPCITCSVH